MGPATRCPSNSIALLSRLEQVGSHTRCLEFCETLRAGVGAQEDLRRPRRQADLSGTQTLFDVAPIQARIASEWVITLFRSDFLARNAKFAFVAQHQNWRYGVRQPLVKDCEGFRSSEPDVKPDSPVPFWLFACSARLRLPLASAIQGDSVQGFLQRRLDSRHRKVRTLRTSHSPRQIASCRRFLLGNPDCDPTV